MAVELPRTQIELNVDGIPAELKTLRHWVAWRSDPPRKPGGKRTKVPVDPNTGKNASSTNPKTWGTCDEALACMKRLKLAGIGFMFQGSGYVGIDIDDCRDPKSGEIVKEVIECIEAIATYTEHSPSGTGVHLILKGKLPGPGRRQLNWEIYDGGRYFTFTGAHVPGIPTEIAERPEQIEYLYKDLGTSLADQLPAAASKPLDDDELIAKATRARNGAKFTRLMAGNSEGYKSESEAEFALLGIIKFYTQDPAQIDSVFRRSKLLRPKWDHKRGESTYGRQSIERILAKGSTARAPEPGKPVAANVSIDKTPTTPHEFAIDGRATLTMRASDGHKTADECVRRLAREKPPTIFVSNRKLVMLVPVHDPHTTGDHRDRLESHELTEPGLCDQLNRRIQFERLVFDRQKNEFVSVVEDCPMAVARWIQSRGAWPGIPTLSAVMRMPTISANFELISQPGFDGASGIYLDIRAGEFPDIPKAPTYEDAQRAIRDHIDPLFEGFPFDQPCHRAVAFSALFSGVARPGMRYVPMHAMDAPTMESGKTLLVETIGIVIQGYEPPSISLAASDEEMEKRVTALLLEGRRIGLIDNIRRPLGGDLICTALTSATVGVRPFHTQKMIPVSTVGVVWFATGNNLQFDKDMRSRAVRCRIDPRMERPGERTFKIPDLRVYARENRPSIVAAVLTCLLAYIHAGRPKQDIKPFNRFRDWSLLVRSALVWLGIGDPVDSMDGPEAADEETDELGSLLRGLQEAFGTAEFTAADAISEPSLKDLLDVLARARSGEGHDAKRLGRVLQRGIGRVVGGLRLERAGKSHNTNSYRVVELNGGSGGSGGIPLSHSRAPARVHTTHEEGCSPACVANRTIPPLPPLPPEKCVHSDLGRVSQSDLDDAAAHEAEMSGADGVLFDNTARAEDPA